MTRLAVIATVGALLAGAFLPGCQAAPFTGRRRLMLVTAREEAQLGVQAWGDLRKDLAESRDAASGAILNRVGLRIAEQVRLAPEVTPTEFEWEFKLFQSDEPNAFCLPGGKVGFHTGILPACRNEAGVAVVMGHEIAHAVLRHGAERMSQDLLATLAGAALLRGMQRQDKTVQEGVMKAFGLGAQVGVLLPYSRAHESEADRVGLLLTTRAGYDPSEAVAFWKRMVEQTGGSRPPAFLSTHPAPADRIEQIEKLMPQMMKAYDKSPKHGLGETLKPSGR